MSVPWEARQWDCQALIHISLKFLCYLGYFFLAEAPKDSPTAQAHLESLLASLTLTLHWPKSQSQNQSQSRGREVLFAYKKRCYTSWWGGEEVEMIKHSTQYQKVKCDYLRAVELWVLFALGLVTYGVLFNFF